MMKTLSLFVLCCFLVLQAAPVDHIGALSVQNGVVVGSNGSPANLRGMSFFWNIAPEARDYYNASVVNWLADDWNANLVRAAMAVEDNWGAGQEGYEYQPVRNKGMVTTVVDAAVQKGIYVIIDWHSHWSADQNNPQRLTKAIQFFQEMATAYGHLPNIIYEVYNEPGFGAGDWAKVKSFNQSVVDAIRAIDPDNLIIVGTPQYSSAVDVATASPLPAGYTNIAYSFHMYASDAGHDAYRNQANTALSRGYALFVSEWGVSQASGGGALDYARIQGWLDWMTNNNLSWAAWSISNKSESSAALNASASTLGNWSAGDLSAAGTWYRNTLRSLNSPWNSVPVYNPGSSYYSKSQFQIQPQTHGFKLLSPGDFSVSIIAPTGKILRPEHHYSNEAIFAGLNKGLHIVHIKNHNQNWSIPVVIYD
jgi:endoglucanase